MEFFATAEAGPAPQLRDRGEIPDRYKWNLTHIFPDWSVWQTAFVELETKIAAYAALQGWMQEHGHESDGPPREIYLVGPCQASDPSAFRTELQWPIR